MRLQAAHIVPLARGCALLGAGGGGDVWAASLLLGEVLARAGGLDVVDPVGFAGQDPDALVCFTGAVGSPTVLVERLPGQDEFARALISLQERSGRPLAAVAPLEIGGVNGMLGLVGATQLGLPVLDADAMGRAFPRLDHTVLAGSVPACPAVVATSGGGLLTLEGLDIAGLEAAVRAVLPALGTWAAIAMHVCTAREAAALAVPGSISRAVDLGRDHADAPGRALGGGRAPGVSGTVVEVRRALRHRGGDVTIAQDDGAILRVDFADELMVASRDGEPIAWVPDVIALVDERLAKVVRVDDLRVGQRLGLVVIPAPDRVHEHGARLGLDAYALAGWGS